MKRNKMKLHDALFHLNKLNDVFAISRNVRNYTESELIGYIAKERWGVLFGVYFVTIVEAYKY